MSQQLEVHFVVLDHARDLPQPSQASARSAGWDLRAAIEAPLRLAPLERQKVPTGLVLAIPPGYEGQVRPRSGRALREGLTLINTPGTIDSDYRGEVAVLLINLGADAVEIRRGERIAQLLITPVPEVLWRRAQQLEQTERGEGGFGSSGR